MATAYQRPPGSTAAHSPPRVSAAKGSPSSPVLRSTGHACPFMAAYTAPVSGSAATVLASASSLQIASREPSAPTRQRLSRPSPSFVPVASSTPSGPTVSALSQLRSGVTAAELGLAGSITHSSTSSPSPSAYSTPSRHTTLRRSNQSMASISPGSASSTGFWAVTAPASVKARSNSCIARKA